MVILVIAVPILVYIPPVQDFARKIAVKEIKKSTGMDIEVDRLRLKFPLRVELAGVSIVEKEAADTMLKVAEARVDVRMLPLLKGSIEASDIGIEDVTYNLGSPDSLLWLRTSVRHAEIHDGGISLKQNHIVLDRARLDGIDTRLILKPDTAPSPREQSAAKPWLIEAREIELTDVAYTMSLTDVIDSLSATIDRARLLDGHVDTGRNLVKARFFGVDSVAAIFLTGIPAGGTAKPTVAADTVPSLPWTITADSLRLTGRSAIYGIRGTVPARGFDPSWISVTGITIAVDDFLNRGTTLRVPIKQLSGRERSGLDISVRGLFAMDSTALMLDNLTARAGGSVLDVRKATMGLLNPDMAPLLLDATASIRPADVALALPSVKKIADAVKGAVNIVADIDGSLARLNVRQLDVNAAGILKLTARGAVNNLDSPARLGGDIKLSGALAGGDIASRLLPPGVLPKGLAIPAMKLDGTVKYSPQSVSADLTASTQGGRMAAKGSWTARSEGYEGKITLDDFPVDAFMPSLGIGRVTASLTARGHGYNPIATTTVADIDLETTHVEYKGDHIKDLTLVARVADGKANGWLLSANPGADLRLDFEAERTGNTVGWDLDGDIRDLDLRVLKILTDTCGGSLKIKSIGTYDVKSGDIAGDIRVNSVDWELPGMKIRIPQADLAASMTKTAIEGTFNNGDLHLKLATREGLDSLMARTAKIPAVVDTILRRHRVDVAELQQSLPRAAAMLEMGTDNMLSDLISQRGLSVNRLTLSYDNDSLMRVSGNVLGFNNGSQRIDSVAMEIYQRGASLVYNVEMNNAPGTFDRFAHVRVNGFLAANRLSAFLNQRDIAGNTGYNLGLLASVADSVVTARLTPSSPTLAYRKFTLNPDNYVSYNLYDRHLDADLSLSDGLTSLKLYTTHPEGEHTDVDDLIAEISNLNLADYLTLSPFAPPMKGMLNANVKLRYDNDVLTGNGDLSLADFFYDRQRVGTFDVGLNLATDPRTGLLRADAEMAVDKVKAMTISGVLNDSTAHDPLKLDFSMIHFPLRVANPFIPEGAATLEGSLNGTMSITGSGTRPRFDGHLSFDSAAVKVTMLGTKLRLPSEEIPVKESIVYFDDFGISAINENPIYINGKVDIGDLANPGVSLNLYGHDVMVVDSDRPRGADVYGKGYLDINADVKGNMSFMVANAHVALLAGSHVTYVLPADQTARLAQGSKSNMVRFVQFSDSALVQASDSVARTSVLLLEANLVVDDGTTINVDLNPDGTNRVSLQANANLTYVSTPVNSGRLTGRININGGFVRYTPPLLSEKLFNFIDGSYVAFNGNMLNPTLNIHAYDVVKANVTRSGENSRLVNFDVQADITGTLQSMNVGFDLSTRDDITVSNELASMSESQRANQAMNLLLYGVYQGVGTTGNANLGGNLLYSFVESTLNNWMANNIKGVDISFGIDQYNQTFEGQTSTAMNYSYHVSKTLFNDRFKIIVGGTYSTAADADDNVAESLFNDISAEYMLNRAGSMYIKIFRNTGYESILEGEITQTGVGFVYRRRLLSLLDIFKPQRSKSSKTTPREDATPAITKPQP